MKDFKELNEEIKMDIVKKIDELYVYHIDKYLEQKSDGYKTHIKNRWISENILDWQGKKIKHSKQIPMFRRSNIFLHLCGHQTYGLFAGKKYTKFITFDVDSQNIEKSQLAARELVKVLHTLFKISLQHIHVIFSGKKGYHVTLYFEHPVSNQVAKKFYIEVMRYVQKPVEVNIEFRPTNKQGVKLPLGIHRTAPGTPRSWFVNKDTFEPIHSFEHILNIKPMLDHSCFGYESFKTEMPPPVVVAPISSVEHFQLNEKEKADLRSFASALIKNGKLTQPGTRHDATLALAIHCRTQGHSAEYTINLILSVLHNSSKDIIQLDETKWLEETERIVKTSYNNGYTFKTNKDYVRIYKPEIARIMQFNYFQLKYFAFANFMLSKSYGPLFYFTFNSVVSKTIINSRDTVARYRSILIEDEFLSLINAGEIDQEESKLREHRFFSKSLFELCEIPFTELDSFIEISFSLDIDVFKNTVRQLFTLSEIKKIVSKHEFYTYWKD